MPNLTRNDWIFIAAGAFFGAAFFLVVQSGLLPRDQASLAFLWIVAPLGVGEVAITYFKGAAPGTLVSTPARIAGLAAGLFVFSLLSAGLPAP
jgi:hypothetical protein